MSEPSIYEKLAAVAEDDQHVSAGLFADLCRALHEARVSADGPFREGLYSTRKALDEAGIPSGEGVGAAGRIRLLARDRDERREAAERALVILGADAGESLEEACERVVRERNYARKIERAWPRIAEDLRAQLEASQARANELATEAHHWRENANKAALERDEAKRALDDLRTRAERAEQGLVDEYDRRKVTESERDRFERERDSAREAARVAEARIKRIEDVEGRPDVLDYLDRIGAKIEPGKTAGDIVFARVSDLTEQVANLEQREREAVARAERAEKALDGDAWREVKDDTAFAPPFGTIRVCSDCGRLVAGGPSRCVRCAQTKGGS